MASHGADGSIISGSGSVAPQDDDGDDDDKSSSAPLCLAFYVTGHGLGHATRVSSILREFLTAFANSRAVIVTAIAPQNGFADLIQPSSGFLERVSFRRAVLDVGAVQADALSVDASASLEAYASIVGSAETKASIIAEEVSFLKRNAVDVVATDVVPVACAAARAAGIPCAAVSNFTWDYIYAAFLPQTTSEQTRRHRALIADMHQDYVKATCLIRMPGHCPMPAFRHIVDVPLVVRHKRTKREVTRQKLGIPLDATVVLYQFGGQNTNGFQLKDDALPDNWWAIMAAPTHPKDGERSELPPRWVLAIDAYIPDIVEASDVLLGKVGYGTVSECLAHRRPLVFVRRSAFGEEPFLRRLIETHACAVEMPRRDFADGRWRTYLAAAARLVPHYGKPTNGALVAAKVLYKLATEGLHSIDGDESEPLPAAEAPPDDAFIMPDWFPAPRLERTNTPPFDVMNPEGDVLHNGMRILSRKQVVSGVNDPLSSSEPRESPRTSRALLAELDDTAAFLDALGHLTSATSSSVSESPWSARQSLPEWRAASHFFVTDPSYVDSHPISVTRAPGRLDVMGGIADYSGSHVLEMPIAEACHVAAQLQPLVQPSEEQPWLWRHVADRVASDAGSNAGAVIRVVSFHADASDRAPTFDVTTKQLLVADGSALVDYDEAMDVLKADHARSWAAYVVGCVYALAKEGHVSLEQLLGNSIAILVSSEVPEGKGVSSSAAIEVATMASLCSLYNVKMDGRTFVRLCQRVENRVCGAPCGIMDQCASAMGRKDELLYLRCTPDDVLGSVPIPHGCVFWGIDSGIRHSVGGSDYGSVRCGAFMGKRIIMGDQSDDATSSHLAQKVAPSSFRARYEQSIPVSMTGEDFSRQYGDHGDDVTRLDPGTTYSVRAPTEHPVSENFRVRMFVQLLLSHKREHGSGNGGGRWQQLLLQAGGARWWDETAPLLGELMLQSHASYGGVGLGSEGTDRLVELAQKQSPSLRGAKITGGGSGGTVVVFGDASRADAAVAAVAARYEAETGYSPKLFRGSSMGAFAFGVLHVTLDRK